MDELATIERLLADALTSGEPWETLQRALADPRTPPGVREALGAIDEDGLRLSALLVAKLRFERIMNGSSRAAAWFGSDPDAFTAAFRRYHLGAPPAELFPGLEGRAFELWLDERDDETR